MSGSVRTQVSVTSQLVALTQGSAQRATGRADIALDPLAVDATGVVGAHIPSTAALFPPTIGEVLPDVVIQAAIVELGDRVPDGSLIAGVAVPWFEIVRHLARDPNFLFRIHWRQLEELIAGAYEREGWSEVVLTSRSGDGGRDIIATKRGTGAIRILDQVKAYHPGHLVAADEVRAMLGVLEAEQNVSKGFVTTTSGFAPGIATDSRLSRYMPYRLELKAGDALVNWLTDLSGQRVPL